VSESPTSNAKKNAKERREKQHNLEEKREIVTVAGGKKREWGKKKGQGWNLPSMITARQSLGRVILDLALRPTRRDFAVKSRGGSSITMRDGVDEVKERTGRRNSQGGGVNLFVSASRSMH